MSPKEKYYQTAARNLFLNREFFVIYDAFSKENIPLIPLKGIAFIQKIYTDIGSRHIVDIDILIKAKDVLPAIKLLNELGYDCPGGVYFNPDKPYSIYLNSLLFSKNSKIPYSIHLHWHILNTTIPLFMYRINMEDIWKEAKPEKHQDKEILMLSAQHQVVYLSIHAFNHAFNKISLFTDIEKVIEFYKNTLDWKIVNQIAMDWGASKILKNKTSRHSVYFLYLDMIDGFFNKIKFIFLTLFPYPEQLRQMYLVKPGDFVYLYYFKRLWMGLMSVIASSQNLRPISQDHPHQ